MARIPAADDFGQIWDTSGSDDTDGAEAGALSDHFRRRRQPAEDAAFAALARAQGVRRFSALFEEKQGRAAQGTEDFAPALDTAFAEEAEAVISGLRQDGHRPSEDGIAQARRALTAAGRRKVRRAAAFENNARAGRIMADLEETLKAQAEHVFAEPAEMEETQAAAIEAIAGLAEHLPPGAADKLRAGAAPAIALAAARGLIDNDPEFAVVALEGGVFAESLSGEQTALLGRRAEAARAGWASEDRKTQVRARAGSLAALEVAIETGAAGEAEIDEAGHMIGAAERRRLIEAAEEAGRRRSARDEGIWRVSEALETGSALADAGDADAYAEDVLLPALAERSGPERARAIAEFSVRAGHVAPAVLNHLRAAFAGDDATAKAEAADLAVRLQEKQPKLGLAFPKRLRAEAAMIANLTAAGVAPERAVEKTNAALADLSESTLAARSRRAALEGHAEENRRFLDERIREIAPDIIEDGRVDALREDFEAIAGDAFLLTGNLEAAQAVAFPELRRRWAGPDGGDFQRLVDRQGEGEISMPAHVDGATVAGGGDGIGPSAGGGGGGENGGSNGAGAPKPGAGNNTPAPPDAGESPGAPPSGKPTDGGEDGEGAQKEPDEDMETGKDK